MKKLATVKIGDKTTKLLTFMTGDLQKAVESMSLFFKINYLDQDDIQETLNFIESKLTKTKETK